ncbi:MAG: gamma-glutamyl-gamma-aminobutyrate hydrolase family protein [Verrucomicrobiota bacterium]|nr:gamma-glutamyl-gamma-aminobutyrate hydrolase family protein [Verrucomicrobiota bacterium]
MPNVATWMRRKDEPFFQRSFAPHPGLIFWNAAHETVPPEEMDGLLLTGGADIAPAYLRQEVPDVSVIDREHDPARDQWEFAATKVALDRQRPILAICKGLQVLNVALGGTLRLDIPGHNDPAMKDHDVQTLRTERAASHRLERVNSSHHQGIERLGEGCEVEAWCANDDIIEQMRLPDHPFALAVQYHPERGGEIYAPLFADFAAHLATTAEKRRSAIQSTPA